MIFHIYERGTFKRSTVVSKLCSDVLEVFPFLGKHEIFIIVWLHFSTWCYSFLPIRTPTSLLSDFFAPCGGTYREDPLSPFHLNENDIPCQKINEILSLQVGKICYGMGLQVCCYLLMQKIGWTNQGLTNSSDCDWQLRVERMFMKFGQSYPWFRVICYWVRHSTADNFLEKTLSLNWYQANRMMNKVCCSGCKDCSRCTSPDGDEVGSVVTAAGCEGQ